MTFKLSVKDESKFFLKRRNFSKNCYSYDYETFTNEFLTKNCIRFSCHLKTKFLPKHEFICGVLWTFPSLFFEDENEKKNSENYFINRPCNWIVVKRGKNKSEKNFFVAQNWFIMAFVCQLESHLCLYYTIIIMGVIITPREEFRFDEKLVGVHNYNIFYFKFCTTHNVTDTFTTYILFSLLLLPFAVKKLNWKHEKLRLKIRQP